MQADQCNQYRPRLISGEDYLLQLYNQQESYILSKGINSPELIQTCNGICQQLKKENRNIRDVQAYYICDNNSYRIMYGIHSMDASVNIKHVSYFLETFEENEIVRFVPFSKVKRFLSYKNRQQKCNLIYCVRKHCCKLFKKHTNLGHISTSPFKEVKDEFINEACIVLHISKKGLIPVGQNYLPKELESSESKYYPVDVQSTKSSFSLVYRANDFFQNLRMGCQVYSPIADGFFTLGGFVIGPNKNIFFVACAHSVLMEETVKEMKECGKCVHEADIESHKVCFQPDHNSKNHCGILTKAVFRTGTDTEPGVDCALVQCCSKRQPASGYFPDSPGLFSIFELSNLNNKKQLYTSPFKKEKFTSGEMLDSDQIPEKSTVYKFGIKTGWTEGTLVCKGDSELKFKDSDFNVCMHGQLKVCNKENGPFSLEGDSGAWVFIKDRDSRLKVIGMVIGFEGNITTVTPISAILKSLNLQKESIVALNGSDSNDLDSFEDDDAQSPSCELHCINEEVRKVRKERKGIPNPDFVQGFGILG